MFGKNEIIQRRNLDGVGLFFLCATLISWGVWIPMALSGSYNQGLLWLAGFGPTLAALALTALRGGKGRWRELLNFHWRMHAGWYLFSMLGTPLVMGAALGLHAALGGARPAYVDPNHLVTSWEQWPGVLVVWAYVFVFTALGEEIGWRGYALPRLQARFSPFVSSLVLGIVWGLWHLPLFWMAGNFHQQMPVSWFILQVLGATFLYTWMCNRNGGSLWLALFFHTSSNAAIGLLPVLPLDNGGSLRPLWFAVGLLWLVVVAVVWRERRLFFKRPVKVDAV